MSASLVNILFVTIPLQKSLFGNIQNIHFQQTQLSDLATILLTERSFWRFIHRRSCVMSFSLFSRLRIQFDRSNDRFSILLPLQLTSTSNSHVHLIYKLFEGSVDIEEELGIDLCPVILFQNSLQLGAFQRVQTHHFERIRSVSIKNQPIQRFLRIL